MEIVYRSKVVKHTLNPEWLEHVSLNMPSADEVITVVTIYCIICYCPIKASLVHDFAKLITYKMFFECYTKLKFSAIIK